eukprot:Hpha_TRINITY_DN15141_c1_g1::TRINITY_DN15141_c1_g1_i10::g.128826::m.128826
MLVSRTLPRAAGGVARRAPVDSRRTLDAGPDTPPAPSLLPSTFGCLEASNDIQSPPPDKDAALTEPSAASSEGSCRSGRTEALASLTSPTVSRTSRVSSHAFSAMPRTATSWPLRSFASSRASTAACCAAARPWLSKANCVATLQPVDCGSSGANSPSSPCTKPPPRGLFAATLDTTLPAMPGAPPLRLPAAEADATLPTSRGLTCRNTGLSATLAPVSSPMLGRRYTGVASTATPCFPAASAAALRPEAAAPCTPAVSETEAPPGSVGACPSANDCSAGTGNNMGGRIDTLASPTSPTVSRTPRASSRASSATLETAAIRRCAAATAWFRKANCAATLQPSSTLDSPSSPPLQPSL